MTTYRDIEIIGATIRNGRIYFSSKDIKFFPSDSFGDREKNGHKGRSIVFDLGFEKLETDIRIYSGQRISPRKSFASYLKRVKACEGDLLRITRLDERNYAVEYLR